MEEFNDRLKELRKSRGFTQKQVADYMGIKEQAYQRYEYGKRVPAFDSLIKLADCFSISLDELVGREFANH